MDNVTIETERKIKARGMTLKKTTKAERKRCRKRKTRGGRTSYKLGQY